MRELEVIYKNIVIQCRKGSSFTLKEVSNISSSLSILLPNLKVSTYFRTKPEVILNSQYVITAVDKNNQRTIGLLCSSVLTCDMQLKLLHIATIFIGEKYQGSCIFNYLWKILFRAVLENEVNFIDAISIKTYNPISMSLLFKTGKRSSAGLYPFWSDINDKDKCFLNKIVTKLNIGNDFDKNRGIIYGGAVGVPKDFYPKLPNIIHPKIARMFEPPLTSNDRLLGCMFIQTNSQKMKLLMQFGLHLNINPEEHINKYYLDY